MADDKKPKTVLERTYTIPLRAAFRNVAPHRKANRAVSAARIFLAKHMKSADVRLGQHLNKALWARGIKSPPPRVTVVAIKDADGVVRAELEGKAYSESVKPLAKSEKATTLKEKLTEKLGGKRVEEPEEADESLKDEDAPKAEPLKADASKAEKPKADAPKLEKKPDAKKAE